MTDDHSAARGFLETYFGADVNQRQATDATNRFIAALTDAGYQITRRDPDAGRVSEPRTHDPDDVPYCRHGFPEGVGCDACRRELTEATTG